VGVSWGIPIPARNRAELLLFDRIAVFGLQSMLESMSFIQDADEADTRWLADRGVLFDVRHVQLSDGSTVERRLEENFDKDRDALVGSFARGEMRPGLTISEWLATVEPPDRLVASWLREVGLNAVPLRFGTVAGMPLTKGPVFQVVIKRLQFPSEAHSLEDLLAFRAEAQAEGLLESLHVWMNNMACSSLTAFEIADALEATIDKYERLLRLKRMRLRTGVVETLVTTTAEIGEALVKFRWSKIAKKLFEVRYKKLDLMEAELTLPGSELAFISRARTRFGSAKRSV